MRIPIAGQMRKAATAATFFGLILVFGSAGTAVGQARNAFFGPNVDTDQVEARVDQLLETLNGGGTLNNTDLQFLNEANADTRISVPSLRSGHSFDLRNDINRNEQALVDQQLAALQNGQAFTGDPASEALRQEVQRLLDPNRIVELNEARAERRERLAEERFQAGIERADRVEARADRDQREANRLRAQAQEDSSLNADQRRRLENRADRLAGDAERRRDRADDIRDEAEDDRARTLERRDEDLETVQGIRDGSLSPAEVLGGEEEVIRRAIRNLQGDGVLPPTPLPDRQGPLRARIIEEIIFGGPEALQALAGRLPQTTTGGSSNEALADALINQFGPGGSQNDGLSVSDLQAILQDLQNLPLSTPTGPLDPASAGLQSDVGQDPAQIGGGACPAGQVLSCSPGFGCSCI